MSLRSLPIRQEGSVADPGEGPRGPAPPPPFLDQNEKKFFGDCPPPLPKGVDDPPLSQGLDPPLRFPEQ